MSSVRNMTKFLVLCLVWGLTWIAVKVGVASVPPMLFASTRFIVAGIAFLGFSALKGIVVIPRGRDVVRLLIASSLMITLCYGPLFWGMKFVASGTAAVLEMSLTPLALLAFGIALREERWSLARVIAMTIGVVGLAILFAPEITAPNTSSTTMFGLAAVAWAAVSSAWGSVLARPLVSNYGSQFLSGSTTLVGGAALLAASLLTESDSAAALSTMWPWQAIAGWLFLVIFGSLIGYRIYMQLLRDIGPAKAGSFAFVSPAIAVGVGGVIAGEMITLQSVSGMVLMLAAAAGCLFADQITGFLTIRRKAKA
jgi:drug/metabolite transporter (DMT)-like permease